MATKFGTFRRAIIANPDKVTQITKIVCCLHSYLKISEAHNSTSNHPYCPPGYVDHEDADGNLIPGDWRLEMQREFRTLEVWEAIHILVQQLIYVTL